MRKKKRERESSERKYIMILQFNLNDYELLRMLQRRHNSVYSFNKLFIDCDTAQTREKDILISTY